MRVLITGITGYIGSRLAKELLHNHQVFGLVREPVHCEYISEISKSIALVTYDGSYESMEQAVRQAEPDIVYHLAACYTGAHGPETTPKLIESNIVLGAQLLEAMASLNCRKIINVSSVMAYYKGEGYCPQNFYAATKQAFSDLLLFYTDSGLMQAVTLVLSDTYGPGDNRPKILNLIKKAAMSGEELILSDGEQDFDLTYIDDVIQAFVKAGEGLFENQWHNEHFQVAPEKPLTLRKTVELMLKVNDLSAKLLWGGRPAVDREIRKAVRVYPTLPGWRAEKSLFEGLKRFLD